MNFLINPNFAYLFIFTAVMLALLSILHPQTSQIKYLLVLCLAAAGFELSQLHANPWALLITALSPLPLFIIVKQNGKNLTMLAMTIAMLTIAPMFIFVDQNGRPLVNLSLGGMLAIFSSMYLLYAVRQKQNNGDLRINKYPESLVGMVGEVVTEIDSLGSVRIDGDLWLARSEKPIQTGSQVRVIRCDGAVLFVKKVEKLTKK